MSEPKLELLDVMMQAISHSLADVHTATIAKVTAVGAKTISCRPVTARVVNGESIPLPEFIDVPVLVLQGGGSYTAYPVAIGDYALLIFTERAFDRWWSGQDFQPPPELRMHDYSDGIAIVGVNPLASALTIPTTIKQVGDTVQEGNYTHTGNLERTGDTALTGDYTQTGDMDVTGASTISGLMQSGSLSVTGSVTIGGLAGISGSFISADAKTITVTNGIITGIV